MKKLHGKTAAMARRYRVLGMFEHGMNSTEIAESLGIAITTVTRMLRRACEDTGRKTPGERRAATSSDDPRRGARNEYMRAYYHAHKKLKSAAPVAD